LKRYFLGLGAEDCDEVVWDFIKDQENGLTASPELSIPECYLWFIHHVMNLFTKYIKLLEADDFSPFQLYDLMFDLRIDLEKHQSDKFPGTLVQNALKLLPVKDQRKFLNVVENVYTRALDYLTQWFDFENSVFRSLAVLQMKERETPNLQECTAIGHLLNISLEGDALYDELTLLEKFMKNLPAESNLIGIALWTQFFQKVGAHNADNLYRIISRASIIPTHNAYCERIFSHMKFLWSDDRNRLRVEMVRAEVCIKNNFNMTCIEFYKYIKEKEKILNLVQSNAKYTFKFKEKKNEMSNKETKKS